MLQDELVIGEVPAPTGIDLVAHEYDLWESVATQPNFYPPEVLISKPDVDS